MTHGGIGLDPSHNVVGRDTNRWSSHIVGRPQSACGEQKGKRFGYAVAKVYDEIASKSSFSLSIAEEAAKAAGTYTTATADERAEIEYLLGDFKVTDTPSDDVYDAVAEGMFGGD